MWTLRSRQPVEAGRLGAAMLGTFESTIGRDSHRPIFDGSAYRLRPVGQSDRVLLRRCFEGLSPESRRLRFFGVKLSLSEADLDFLAGADGEEHIAIGLLCLSADQGESELLGVARCIRLAPQSDTAELAMAMMDRAQGQGLGGLLLGRLVTIARGRGIDRLRCEVFAINQGMRTLLGHLGGRGHWIGDGVLEYECALSEAADARLAPEIR